MSMLLTNSALTVTTAGTRVQLTNDASIHALSVYIEALATNTGYIYVGLSTVSSTIYIARLSSGQAFSLASDWAGTGAIPKGSIDFKLSDFWIDCSVNGEKALITYADAG